MEIHQPQLVSLVELVLEEVWAGRWPRDSVVEMVGMLMGAQDNLEITHIKADPVAVLVVQILETQMRVALAVQA